MQSARKPGPPSQTNPSVFTEPAGYEANEIYVSIKFYNFYQGFVGYLGSKAGLNAGSEFDSAPAGFCWDKPMLTTTGISTVTALVFLLAVKVRDRRAHEDREAQERLTKLRALRDKRERRLNSPAVTFRPI